MSVESKQRGMDKARDGIDPLWRVEALCLLTSIALNNEFVHVDQLWEKDLGKPRVGCHIGIVMSDAIRWKIIEPIKRGSSERGNHEGVWTHRSLVFQAL